jgi:hypothetical protein
LANFAFSSTVPVPWSTRLSAMASAPVSRSSPVSWPIARTGRGRRKPSDATTSRWNSPCGTEKVTAMGCTWLITTMPVAPPEPLLDAGPLEAEALELPEPPEALTRMGRRRVSARGSGDRGLRDAQHLLEFFE